MSWSALSVVFVALLLAALPAQAYLPLTYETFTYDGDVYYLPCSGCQVKAGKPTSTSSPVQWYSNFQTNGATISAIQSCVSGSSIYGMKFIWTDGTSNSAGNINCGSQVKTMQFNVEEGEYVTSMQQQGNNGVLCNFIISTAINGSPSQSVQLGTSSCGGNNGASTDMASGIIGGAIGYAPSSGPVYQLGLLMLQQITNIQQYTASIYDYPNQPGQNQIGLVSCSAAGSSVPCNSQLSYQQSTGYSYDYSTSVTQTTYFGVDVTASYSYAETTPVENESGSISVESQFQYTQSTTTSTDTSTNTQSTVSATMDVCCPPGVSCTWQAYQAQGAITTGNPAQATIENVITFKTSQVITFNSSSAFTGASSYPSIYVVLTTNPPPANGSSIDGVTNYCTSTRRLLAAEDDLATKKKIRARQIDFKGKYHIKWKGIKVKTIVKKLAKAGISKKNLFSHNRQLYKIGMDGAIPKGTRLLYRYQAMAYVQAFKGKA